MVNTWYLKHKEENKELNRKSIQKIKQELETIIGKECIICHGKNRLCVNEKYGNKHKYSFFDYKNHPNDFIPLCSKHHVMIHWLSQVDIKKIIILLQFMGYKFKEK